MITAVISDVRMGVAPVLVISIFVLIHLQQATAKKRWQETTLYRGINGFRTVDTFHRGEAGSEPVVLIVFYAGSTGMPLTRRR